jgi:pyocin large subunit-like protein
VLLVACERSSAVATRSDSGDRKSFAETTTSPSESSYEDRGSGDRAERRDDGPVALVDGKPMWSSSRKGSAEENAQRSFDRNGEDFGASNLEAYVKKAHAFVDNPPAGTQKLKRSNGDVLLYDAKSNVFAVASKAGAPRAMFKPDQGAAYWDQQKARESKRQTARSDRRDRGNDNTDG